MWKTTLKELKLNDVQNAKSREDEVERANKKLKILCSHHCPNMKESTKESYL
jgi:hypothetical protein